MTPVHLTPEQAKSQAEFSEFADRELAPHADRFDAEQAISRDAIVALGNHGYLGAAAPGNRGIRMDGSRMDMVEYGLLAEELGRVCQSVRNFVAVQDMVIHSIARWGMAARRRQWLAPLTTGAAVGAFALTEPGVGSDAAAVATVATRDGDGYVLNGTKRWISFASIADVFLVFASLDGKHSAFLVDRETPGLTVEPIKDLLGLRGSLLGEVALCDCRVPAGNVVGVPGAGLTFVASTALDLGRYSTACGAVGLAEACLRACAEHVSRRTQFGTEIRNHQLVQRMLADMVTDVTAARLLCHHAGQSKDQNSVEAVNHTLMAKYRASTVAARAAAAAVQLHGALGVGSGAVQRYYRDSKVLEIIEGTTEIQQTMLGGFAAQAALR